MADWKQTELPGVFEAAEYDEGKGIFTYERAVDIAPVLEQNLERQKDPANGFFQETRDSRHIGEIPEVIYYRDVLPKFRALEAKGFTGEDLRIHKGTILRNFLTEHPEYMTVDKMVHHTANETNIVVK